MKFSLRTILLLLVPPLSGMMGCAAFHPIDGIPVDELPMEQRLPMRSGKQMIDPSLLRQTPPAEHLVDAGDILGIYIEGILGGQQQSPPVNFPQNPNSHSSLGYPIRVRTDGTISLPLADPINVRGKTLIEVERTIRHTYTQGNKPLLKRGNDRILVTLQRPRHYRVLVIRQEAGNPSNVSGQSGRVALINTNGKRGTGSTVALPAYENDVLHALTQTGGLPGLDAQNVVYIIRRRRPVKRLKKTVRAPTTPANDVTSYGTPSQILRTSHQKELDGGSPGHTQSVESLRKAKLRFEDFGGHSSPVDREPAPSYRHAPSPALPVKTQPRAPRQVPVSPARTRTVSIPVPVPPKPIPEPPMVAAAKAEGAEVIRIPLRLYPGEPLTFSPSDVILQDGDVVFIESRITDVFYTGGLLGGGRIQLPRDYDIDVIQAIAMVQSSQNRTLPTRSVGGIAATNQDVTSSASELIVLRPTPCGGQMAIKVNLYKALRDPNQRIYVRPGDHLVLQYSCIERCAAVFERHILDGFILGISSGLFFSN